MSPLTVVGLLLALSVAGNAWLFNSRDVALAERATFEHASKDTAVAAKACSDGVEGLAADGKKRHADLLTRIKAQAGQVAALEGASIAALNARPADPGDLCKSLAQYLAGEIRKERGVR
ncbi:MAG: hypothetical protein A3H93_18120 [Rhodocyclales bacterium RIFCSPLOWO2_02_FULL_63_24]|nr:MAG: hypothetical protein A3H93_18120 [Rhodocyclales bacterium RIFCSPLOWO2_02_FULL_63_24]